MVLALVHILVEGGGRELNTSPKYICYLQNLLVVEFGNIRGRREEEEPDPNPFCTNEIV